MSTQLAIPSTTFSGTLMGQVSREECWGVQVEAQDAKKEDI